MTDPEPKKEDWPEVELAIDVIDDPPRPFVAKDPTHAERVKRYRKRHPGKWAATVRRHNERGGSLPGDFGGYRRGRIPWDAQEEARVMEHAVRDRQLAEELNRSLKAIIVRRSQIKRRSASSEGESSG